MTFTFDTAPRIFLVVGGLLLALAAMSFFQDGGFTVIAAGMGALFLVAALATSYAPKK